MSIGNREDFLRPDDGWDQSVWGRINQGRRELAAVLARDVTVERLAWLIGLKQSSLSGWKKGSRPTRENLQALEQLFLGAGLIQFTARFLDYGAEDRPELVARDTPALPPRGPGEQRKGA